MPELRVDSFISDILLVSASSTDQVHVDKDCKWKAITAAASKTEFTLDMTFYDLTNDADDTIVLNDDSLTENEPPPAKRPTTNFNLKPATLVLSQQSADNEAPSNSQRSLQDIPTSLAPPPTRPSAGNQSTVLNRPTSENQTPVLNRPSSIQRSSIHDVLSSMAPLLPKPTETVNARLPGNIPVSAVNNAQMPCPSQSPRVREVLENIQNQASQQQAYAYNNYNAHQKRTSLAMSRLRPADKENDVSISNASMIAGGGATCPKCNRIFKSVAGVRIHDGLTHKKREREEKLRQELETTATANAIEAANNVLTNGTQNGPIMADSIASAINSAFASNRRKNN